MKVYLDCIPCFLRQALEAARWASDDERCQRTVLDTVARLIPGLPLNATPIDMGREIHRAVREVTGTDDPYCEVKKQVNDRALELYSECQKRVEASADPLFTALKVAAAGNVIDFATHSIFDLDLSIEECLKDGVRMADYPALKKRLEDVAEVLYLGDNAGEIVFDKLVVEQLVKLGRRVTYVVRGGPIINDVTVDDASYVGMDEIAQVVSSGSDGPGTTLRWCRAGFIDRFRGAKLIISKGQGNFEGLSDVTSPIFFLLKVKCPVVAQELGEELGEIVLRAQKDWKRRAG